MLAYVFWHWRQPLSERQQYESYLADFHTSLAQQPPAGFQNSMTFAIQGAPWAADGAAAYEDWYWVANSAALDPLNDGAIARPHQSSHDAVAGIVAGGTAGLYRLRLGTPLATAAQYAHWFSKPEGMTYQALFAAFEPLTTGAKAMLWGRQMTLGPATEFCLHTAERLTLPNNLSGLELTLSTVWP